MKLLMVDTATIVASAAVIDDDRLMAEMIVNYRRKHSEKMLPAIDHMLQDSGLSIQEIDVFDIGGVGGLFVLCGWVGLSRFGCTAAASVHGDLSVDGR